MRYKLIINRKSSIKKNYKLAICEDLMVIRFHQKNEVETNFNVEKCSRKGALFALTWNLLNYVFLSSLW